LAATSLITGISALFRFDRRHIEHKNSASKYNDLINDVEEILSKRRQFRPDVDITISNLKLRSENLNRYSPTVKIKETDHAVF
jgi:hypothetical protein